MCSTSLLPPGSGPVSQFMDYCRQMIFGAWTRPRRADPDKESLHSCTDGRQVRVGCKMHSGILVLRVKHEIKKADHC